MGVVGFGFVCEIAAPDSRNNMQNANCGSRTDMDLIILAEDCVASCRPGAAQESMSFASLRMTIFGARLWGDVSDKKKGHAHARALLRTEN